MSDNITPPANSASTSPEPNTPTGLSLNKAVQVETPIPKEADNPWETCLKYVKKHADEEITVWKDEVDKLLIFAGLFSGVVASFAVEAYHNIREDPADTTVLLLKELLMIQLNATNPQPGLAGVELNPRTPVSPLAKGVAILHFLSLLLSLSTAMGGILCLQWIREYNRSLNSIPGPRREHLGVHFMRYRGFENWHVFTILTTLPFFLLVSLVLFFVGIVVLLLNVDHAVGAVATVMAGLTFLFIIATTLLPSLIPCIKQSQCPFKSPQAWLFHQFLKKLSQLLKAFSWLRQFIPGNTKNEDREREGEEKMGSEREGGIKDVAGFWSWSDYDWHVYQDLREAKAASIGHALHWLGAMYLQFQSFADAFFECITSDDRTVSESLRGVLEQQDRRRWDSARRAIEWPSQNSQQQLSERLMEKKVQEHGQNVLVSHTLAHLADKIEQKQSSDILLNKRLELFLAINRGPRPDINADFPLVSNAYMKHFVLRERRLKFLKSILEMFTKDFRFNETHINAVKSILRLEYQENEFNAGVFTETINVLDGWINARGREPRDNTNLEVITRLKNHVSVLSRLRV